MGVDRLQDQRDLPNHRVRPSFRHVFGRGAVLVDSPGNDVEIVLHRAHEPLLEHLFVGTAVARIDFPASKRLDRHAPQPEVVPRLGVDIPRKITLRVGEEISRWFPCRMQVPCLDVDRRVCHPHPGQLQFPRQTAVAAKPPQPQVVADGWHGRAKYPRVLGAVVPLPDASVPSNGGPNVVASQSEDATGEVVVPEEFERIVEEDIGVGDRYDLSLEGAVRVVEEHSE